MALYEYKCSSCENKFEVRRSWDNEGSAVCPKCGGESWRVFSPGSLIFGGSAPFSEDSSSSSSSCGTSRRYSRGSG